MTNMSAFDVRMEIVQASEDLARYADALADILGGDDPVGDDATFMASACLEAARGIDARLHGLVTMERIERTDASRHP